MVVSMISALARVPVRHDLAMTGEITLTGKVLPIGGVKEKVLAAYRAGIRKVVLPRENEKDLQEVPEEVKKVMNFFLVENINQVLELALAKEELIEINN